MTIHHVIEILGSIANTFYRQALGICPLKDQPTHCPSSQRHHNPEEQRTTPKWLVCVNICHSRISVVKVPAETLQNNLDTVAPFAPFAKFSHTASLVKGWHTGTSLLVPHPVLLAHCPQGAGCLLRKGGLQEPATAKMITKQWSVSVFDFAF